ncbi:transcriptional regulator [Dyella japonica]|uniref:transcriptional regulator n=1 Tax=Dyella japonica TaxID=231455 RepID=UPI00339B2536
MTRKNHESAIHRAVRLAGGQTSLATKVGVSQGLVWQWCNGARIPTRHFESIEKETGVSAQELLADEMAKDRNRAA